VIGRHVEGMEEVRTAHSWRSEMEKTTQKTKAKVGG